MDQYIQTKSMYLELKRLQYGGLALATPVKQTEDQEIEHINYQDNMYHYQYVPVKYASSEFIGEPNPAIEITRAQEYNKIRDHFRHILKQNNIIPKKDTVTKNADKILTRYIFHNFSHKPIYLAKDGLFHYDDDDDGDGDGDSSSKEVIIIDLMSVFKDVELEHAKDIEKQIQINHLFDVAINNLSKVTNTTNTTKVYEKNITDQWIIFLSSVSKLTIAPKIYDRLFIRYQEYKELYPHNLEFDDLVFVLLQRYHTLASEGHQWGMPYAIREKFKDMGFNFECFASAFNHYLDHYCSMFYDIEKYFMSRGPFQNVTYIKGLYMANPPYELNLLNEMVDKFIRSIEKTKEELAFMYGLPDWTRFGESFQFIDMSNNSKYYKYHIRFEPYKYPWHDFMDYNKVHYIPQSFRYVLANYDIDVKLISQIIAHWANLK